jgi:hypothetical protein
MGVFGQALRPSAASRVASPSQTLGKFGRTAQAGQPRGGRPGVGVPPYSRSLTPAKTGWHASGAVVGGPWRRTAGD